MLADDVETRIRALFRDLGIAARAIAAYPPGHPVLVAGLAGASKALGALLERTGSIELVATRDGLVHGERRFTEPSPARLAALLRRRRAGSLSFLAGVTDGEIERFLRAIMVEQRVARSAGSLAEELVAAGVTGLVVTDLDFSSIVLVEGDTGAAEEDLWSRIAQRLTRLGELDPERIEAWLASGGTIAELLRSLLGREAGALGGEVGSGASPGPGAGGGAAEVAGVGSGAAGGAGPEVGGGVGPAGGSGASRSGTVAEHLIEAAVGAFVENPEAAPAELAEVASWLKPTARRVLARELHRALALQADGDRRLAAFFSALPADERARLREAVAPPPGGAGGAVASDPGRVARLRRTLADADIDIVLSESSAAASGDVLLELAGGEAATSEASPLSAELEEGAIARAAASSLLELAERDETTEGALVNLLAKVESAYRSLLLAGRFRQALDVIERIQHRARRGDPIAGHFRRSAERLSSRESLVALSEALSGLPPDGLEIARQIVERLGATAARHLIGLLAESDDRDQRRRLLDLLAGLGPLVVRDSTHLLADPRWYVVRNVLLLLRRVGDPGSLPAVRKCAEHPDLRVRLEAIRNLFAFDSELPRELLRQAFQNKDPRLAGEAIDLAAEHRMVEAGELLVALLNRWDLFGARKPVRLKAIRALAEIGDAQRLSGLPRYGARFKRMPVSKEEQIAFYRSLASYPAGTVGSWIALGLRSPLAEVRRIAAELERRERPA